MESWRRKLFLLRMIAPLALIVWLQSSGEVRGDDKQQNAEAAAQKVEQKAERTEKAEGKHDLVKDSVQIKTNAEGEKVIEQKGEASFYGKGFHGKKTASGEKFDQHDFTAAHPALPLGSEAKVTNLENGKSVEVEINDRGPYTKGRDLDVSKAAAQELGMKKDGEVPVKIEAVVPAEQEKAGTAAKQDDKDTQRKKE